MIRGHVAPILLPHRMQRAFALQPFDLFSVSLVCESCAPRRFRVRSMPFFLPSYLSDPPSFLSAAPLAACSFASAQVQIWSGVSLQGRAQAARSVGCEPPTLGSPSIRFGSLVSHHWIEAVDALACGFSALKGR